MRIDKLVLDETSNTVLIVHFQLHEAIDKQGGESPEVQKDEGWQMKLSGSLLSLCL